MVQSVAMTTQTDNQHIGPDPVRAIGTVAGVETEKMLDKGSTRFDPNSLAALSVATSPVAPPERNDVGQKYVDAVVDRASQGLCILRCEDGGVMYDLRLPLSLVPDDLQMHGQTVRISLDRSLGYRVPKVERRLPQERELTEAEREILAWASDIQ
jgi:hypothetical protein